MKDYLPGCGRHQFEDYFSEGSLSAAAFAQESDGFDFFNGIWICDAKARFLLVNLASARINGVEVQDVLGKNIVKLAEGGLVDLSVAQTVLQEKIVKTLIQHTKAGKQILVTGYPVFSDRGEIIFAVITERDLTDLTKLRMELEKSRSPALVSGFAALILAIAVTRIYGTYSGYKKRGDYRCVESIAI